MNSEYEVYFFQNFIEKYAKTANKAVVYIRTYGWNHGKDIEKINNSMDTYSELLPLDMMTVMKNSEFVFIEVDDINEAMEFFQDNFPENQENCELEYYVHFSLYNSSGQLILSN